MNGKSLRTMGRAASILGILMVLAFAGPSTPLRASPLSPLGASPSTPLKAACPPNTSVLCLDSGRFLVSVAWRQAGGPTGVGSVVPGATTDSGLFWFFTPTNYELMVKVLNGCGFNGRYWVFFLATTNVGFTLSVTDTQTHQVKTYDNPPGSVSPVVTDTSAFSTCP